MSETLQPALPNELDQRAERPLRRLLEAMLDLINSEVGHGE
ncbi:MAG: hypothetical protein WKF52_04780 [Sphingomicrobium sp.]